MSMGPEHMIAANAAFTEDVVVFDVAPKPLAGPRPSRVVVQEALLPVISETGAIVSSGIIYTDMGAHVTQQEMSISVDFMSAAKVDTLWKLWWDNAIIYYTPNSGATVYTLQWGQNGLNLGQPIGIIEWYTVQLAFHVIAITTT